MGEKGSQDKDFRHCFTTIEGVSRYDKYLDRAESFVLHAAAAAKSRKLSTIWVFVDWTQRQLNSLRRSLLSHAVEQARGEPLKDLG